MKIIDLLNAQPIIQQLVDRKMPAKLAYGLAKNFRLITQDLEDYDKARLSILQANWKEDKKTNKFNIPEKDQEKWEAMHKELIEAEAGYQPYIVNLALIEKIEMTPGELMTLWFIFDGDGLGPSAEVT